MDEQNTKSLFRAGNIGIIIPTYNNEKTLKDVVDSVIPYCNDIIVVDDGSTDSTKQILKTLPAQVNIVSYEQNRGKGNALKLGFKKAREMGLNAVITIDSDGQHLAKDLPIFANANLEHPDSLIVGSRSFLHPNMPQKNSFANRFSNFWFTLQTGKKIPDTQTGYRLYPLKKMGKMTPVNKRYEAELELLVRCAWRNISIVSRNINVYYPPKEERISHFRPTVDFVRISLLNTLLCFLSVLYGYPSIFIRKCIHKICK